MVLQLIIKLSNYQITSANYFFAREITTVSVLLNAGNCPNFIYICENVLIKKIRKKLCYLCIGISDF